MLLTTIILLSGLLYQIAVTKALFRGSFWRSKICLKGLQQASQAVLGVTLAFLHMKHCSRPAATCLLGLGLRPNALVTDWLETEFLSFIPAFSLRKLKRSKLS